MSAGVRQVELENVAQVLRELKRVDPELRRRAPNEIKGAARGLLADVKARLPGELTPAMSRTSGKWRYPGRARSQVSLKFRGTAPRGAPSGSWPLLRIVSKNPALAAAEMARTAHAGTDRRGRRYGTNRGNAWLRALPGGRPGRYVWPTVEAGARDVEREVERIVDRYSDIVSRRLR